MTNEEAITVLSVLKNNEGILENEQNVDALIMAISALESHRWIPVTERMPEKSSSYYQVCYKDFYGKLRSSVREFCIDTVRGNIVERWRYPWGNISDEDILFWKPIDEPPKEENA